MIKFDVDVRVNESKLKRKAESAHKAAQMQLDQDVLKDSNYFIPKETGELERSGIRHTKPGTGQVVWKTAYAKRLYYNPQYNFSKDVNPNARGLWFEAAKSLHKKDWLSTAREKYRKFFRGR
jgi:hypothetical protein